MNAPEKGGGIQIFNVEYILRNKKKKSIQVDTLDCTLYGELPASV